MLLNGKPVVDKPYTITPHEQHLLYHVRYTNTLKRLTAAMYDPINVDRARVESLTHLASHYFSMLTDQMAQDHSFMVMLQYNKIVNDKPYVAMTASEQHLLYRVRYTNTLNELAATLFVPHNVDSARVKSLTHLASQYFSILADQLSKDRSVEQTYRNIFVDRCKLAGVPLISSFAFTVLASWDDLSTTIHSTPCLLSPNDTRLAKNAAK